MHKPQIHEVVLAPALLWNHMVYVGFLAIFQVLVTTRAESLLPLKEPHSIGFSGGQLPSTYEGSSTLDFPLIYDAQSQDHLENNINNINSRLRFYH
jgi:hypothetical protein